MAGFNFDSIKNGFSKIGDSFAKPQDDRDYEETYEENAYEEDYEGGYQEDYEEEYEDDASYSEDAYEEEYASDGYEEASYDEASYDEPYDDAYQEAGEYDDGAYYQEDEEASYDDEGEYAESEYDEYDEEGYDSPSYDEYDEDSEDLGYNPAVFANLDSEDGDYDDGEYADEYGDEDGVYDDDGEYYEDGYAEEEPEQTQIGAVLNNVLSFILENDIVMYAALVLLPPLGIYLLWKKNKFDITVRSALSIASLIWMIIILIILLSRGGDDPTAGDIPNNFMQHTATLAPSNSPAATVPAVQPTEPSATPNTNVGTGIGTGNGTGTVPSPAETQITYVYATNNDAYYHAQQNCGGMTNASTMTLDSATSRGKTACPVCIGGVTTPGATGSTGVTGTQYYATARGTWYHINSSCQGMTGASVVTEANAIAAGKTACPECIGFYGTPGGKYYHNISNCSGMLNAITKTEAEWKANGKTACKECIGSGNKVGSSTSETYTTVYATKNGTYYHTIENCSGMKDASKISIASAIENKKKMCTKCVTPENLYVFATSGGTYFHTKNNCSGMKDAQRVTAKFAISYGKKACPTCAKMLADSSGSGSSGTNVNTNASNSGTTTSGATGTGTALSQQTDVMVYATPGGTYFHTKSNCTGMANAQKVTFKQAVSAGKKYCPTCVTPKTLTVFATSDGKWFHTNANCQGMKNAVTGTAEKAMSYGKTACPVCAKDLMTSSTSGNNTTTAGNTTANNNNNNNSFTSGTGGNTFTSGNSTNNNASTTGTASSTVYYKANSKYYHVGARCNAQNFTGGSAVTLEYVIDRNYTACPSCNPPSKITY